MTRREFCAEIAATAALASPMSFAAIPAEGLKPMIKYRGGKSKEFAQYERFIPRGFSESRWRTEVLCCDYKESFEREVVEVEWRAAA